MAHVQQNLTVTIKDGEGKQIIVFTCKSAEDMEALFTAIEYNLPTTFFEVTNIRLFLGNAVIHERKV